jgi:RES domain-containing protein
MDVDTVAVDGEWIRHAPHRSSLLGRASEATDGRWQHGEVVRALYLADEPATAIAEWYRLLAERGLPPGRAIPHDHHVWQLDLQLADLSTPERLARVTLTPPTPGRRTWPPFLVCGRAAVPCGFRRHPRAQRRSPTRTCQLHLRPRRLASRRLPAPESH